MSARSTRAPAPANKGKERRDLDYAFKIHDSERVAKIPVGFGLKIEPCRFSDFFGLRRFARP